MKNGPGLKMYFLLNMGIFYCYVSLPEGIFPGIPTTIKTMGVNITTIVYLRVLIIQIGEKPLF